MRACSSITSMARRSCRREISKSFGSCAGVTLTTPVPNFGSTASSAITRISRFRIGSTTRLSGECVARPIARPPPPLPLLSDRPAAFLLPLPATLDKFLVAHLAAALLTFAAPSGFGASALEIGESFAAELHFDDHLRGNRGVVHTG